MSVAEESAADVDSTVVVADTASEVASSLVVDTVAGTSTLVEVDGVADSAGDGVALRPQAAAAVDTPVP